MSKTKNPHSTTSNRQQWNLVILVAAVILLVLGYRYLKSAAINADFPLEISVQQAADEREKGAFMLDVRQPEEWEQFHIPDSTLIPLGELESRLSELPRDQKIVVVCRSGNRSAKGRDLLQQAGFKEMTSMAGGVTEWKNAGYPTVSGP